MDQGNAYVRPTSPGYPSPNAQAVGGDAGPFFNQAAQEAAQVPPDLARLEADHEPPDINNGSPSTSVAHDPATYPQAGPAVDDNLQEQTSPERMAQGVLNIDGQPPAFINTEASNGRKRSKVSRACDECRRKKIRCDATLEHPDEPCSSCKKMSIYCQFSREPLKRGPSKGYIKELAARLNSLEHQLGPQAQQTQYSPGQYARGLPEGYGPETDDFYPQQLSPESRKRRLQGPGMDIDGRARPSGDEHESSLRSAPNRHHQRGGSWGYRGNEPSQRETVGMPLEGNTREADMVSNQELDESILDEYYHLMHQTFPLLPHSKSRLRTRLANCSATLREAFIMALDAFIRTYPSSDVQGLADSSHTIRRASELISASQFEPASSRNLSTDLVYIQTLILMALESDNHGPATMRGQVGPPRAEWLGRAIGVATHRKLNLLHPRDRFGEGDPDGDEKLGRRVWWVLFILDRWHASSTSQLLQLPENSSTLQLEDQLLLGESAYHLARLSYILGHLSTILQQPPSLMSPSSAAGPIITTTVLGEVDRFRESVESVLLGAPNLVHLCYWHVRLLTLRLTSSTPPHELLIPAMRMANILNSSYTTITPLNHHFAALAALTLCELADLEETRQGATKGIEYIVEALGSKRGFSLREDSAGWDSAIRELVTRRRAQGTAAAATDRRIGETTAGLQHLADAAIGGDRGVSGILAAVDPPEGSAAAFDPTVMTRYGYLAALVQEHRV